MKDWEENDYYDSDEDEFLDRTGTIQEKRRKRMRMAGQAKDTVETYESLMKKFGEAEAEVAEVEAELNKALERRAKAEKRSAQNDLDSYMAELKRGAQVDKETVTKLKVRIQNLNLEKDRLAKLINIAKPASLPELKMSSAPAKPKSNIMIGKMGSRGFVGKVKSVAKDSVSKPIVASSEKTRKLEAFLQDDAEKEVERKKLKTTAELDEGDVVKPIGYEVQKPVETVPKERIGDTSENRVPRGPSIPQHILDAMKDNKENSENTSTEEPEPSVEKSEEKEISKTKIRGDRGSKRKTKPVEEDVDEETSEEYYKVGMDSKYDVWMPPQGQSGDGKTSLNEKLGY